MERASDFLLVMVPMVEAMSRIRLFSGECDVLVLLSKFYWLCSIQKPVVPTICTGF